MPTFRHFAPHYATDINTVPFRMTFTCGICWREFPAGWRSREQHFEATGHEEPNFECDTCDRYFGTQNTKNQHMTALNHWREYECDDCSDGFYDEDDLRNHEASKHFYCDPCDRYFDSYNSIKNVGSYISMSDGSHGDEAHITSIAIAKSIARNDQTAHSAARLTRPSLA